MNYGKLAITRILAATSIVLGMFARATFAVKLYALRVLSVLNALTSQVLNSAYHAFSERTLRAVGAKRVGAGGAFNTGFEVIVLIIFLVVAIYVAAFTLPGALTAMATSALTSVNGGIITLFQVVVSLIAVVALILLLIAAVRKAFM